VQSLIAVAAAAVAATLSFAPTQPAPLDPAQLKPAATVTVPCTNTLQDAQRINRRIANSKPGDEIVFNGPCLINQTIKLLGGRTYRGGSRTGTQMMQADGANLPAIFASDSYLDNSPTTGLPFTLRSLTIDGNLENNPTSGDSIVLRSWQTTVSDIEINGSGRDGIRLTSLSANGTELTNTQVNGRIATMQINKSGRHGIKVEDPGNHVTDWQFADNYIAGTGGDGVSIDNTAGWLITGNHIYGVDGQTALDLNRLYGSSVHDNYIEDFGEYGIYAAVQGGAASTISSNRVFKFNDGDGTYVFVRGNYANAKLSVTGNAIRGNGGGIGLDYQRGSAESLEVVSTGNLVSEVAVQRQVGEGVILNPGVRVAADNL
jgi:hypothetical protein